MGSKTLAYKKQRVGQHAGTSEIKFLFFFQTGGSTSRNVAKTYFENGKINGGSTSRNGGST